jgi:hypothetical protein
MTTYTEPQRPFEFVISEADGTLSRETVTIVAGQTGLVPGMVLGQITKTGAATSAAFAANTGNGTMGAVTVSAGAVSGNYKLVIIEPGTNVGTFTIEDPNGKFLGRGAVAAAYTGGGIAFTLADGATDFIAGDGFTISVTAGSGKYGTYDDGNTDGTEVATAILLEEVDATADVSAAVIFRIAEVKTSALKWAAANDSTSKSAAYVQLATKNIIAR